MGQCLNTPAQELNEQVQYSSNLSISIASNDALGHVTSRDRIRVRLPRPKMLHMESFRLDSLTLTLSCCVIPGLDPREEVTKECQDGMFHVFAENQLLFGLFDGHGKEGLKVVEFSSRTLKAFFLAHMQEFKANAEAAIVEALHHCDAQVKEQIECSVSGTCVTYSTAVIIYINDDKLIAASVGDSRGVLAALPDPSAVMKQQQQQGKTFTNKGGKYRRPIVPTRFLAAVPLTIDQKPNHQEEMDRIIQSGGRVSRLTDEYGNRIGPYRIWRQNGNLPGLAMSRSIGDKIASEIGVISTPIVQQLEHSPGQDQFIVVASDGVWCEIGRDVMDNEEVVAFVERFRKICAKTPPTNVEGVVQATNSIISQLLCEEARYRWLGVVEEEDVMVDDISCAIIEFDAGISSELSPRARRLAPKGHISLQVLERDSVFAVLSSDPKRNSLILEENLLPAKHQVVRKDMIRGSVVEGEEDEK